MPKLIITRGLQASGKTTQARAWVAENPAGRARINRDDLRAMCHASVHIKQDATTTGTEKAIVAIRDTAIAALLQQGVDVVCDDTNLPSRAAQNLRRLATLNGAEFEVWDLTNAPLEDCLRRNRNREGHARVPEKTMRDLWHRYIKGKPHPLPIDDPEGDSR